MRRNKQWMAMLVAMCVLVILMLAGFPMESRAMYTQDLSQSDWPMLQHDVQHSGYAPDHFVSPGYDGTLNIKWKVGSGERVEVEMQPIVAYGHVYIGVMNGKLYAINEETGEVAWTYQAGGAISHTPAAGAGKVFFGSEDHKVYALDAQTGEEIWIYETGAPVLSSSVVQNDVVYIGSFDHYLYAINTETGQLEWRYDAGDRVWTSPSLDTENNRLYFGSEQPKAHCLDSTTGRLIWERDLTGEGMRNTYPTFAHNVVIFQTIKPGVSTYKVMEDFPGYQDDATSLRQYADYYSRHPERRHLYYLSATSGEDMWDGTSTRYVPVVIPYWGMISPVIDPQGYAWITVHSGGDTRNIDLYKVDLSNGNYIKVAEKEDFFERGDETGRFTLADGVYFSTVLSTVGKYDPQSNQETRIFGPFPGATFECAPIDPMPVGCAYVDRIGGPLLSFRSSPLVIANGTGFYATHGWLYALTPNAVASPHSVNLGKDFVVGPPKGHVTYDGLVTELNDRIEQIVLHGHLEPFPYLWNWGESSFYGNLPVSLWQEGEVVRSLAATLPYLAEANQQALKQYLRREVQEYLLDASQYDYEHQCQLYGSYQVVNCNLSEGECSHELKSCWYENNENYVAERVYALYAYAKYTGDWQLIRGNWSFIVSLYNVLVGRFDDTLGHVVTKQWLSGANLDLQSQAAAFYAMREMAAHLGYSDLVGQAGSYYSQVIQAKVYYGKELIPELYKRGVLTPFVPEDVGNAKILYPPGGVINVETDIRQLGWRDSDRIELRTSGMGGANMQLTWSIYDSFVYGYDYPVGYLQSYPEIGEALQPELATSTEKYVQAIAYYNPWWYWGDNGHVSHKADENLYSKPFMAAALFQAKAYILGEDFTTLKNYLPWPVNRAGFRDIYRLQNLVALLQSVAPSTKSVSSSLADHGDTLTYTIRLMGAGVTATVTDTVPSGTTYVAASARTEPQVGTLAVDSNRIHWAGALPEHTPFELTFAITVAVTEPSAIVSTAVVDNGEVCRQLSVTTIANGLKCHLPIVMKH
jgi:uncharacterized repeat protein (TIGR01451 family)